MNSLSSSVLFVGISLLVSVVCQEYPVDASWFADRWTHDDWDAALAQFQEQGGSIVWQRGANFRLRPGGALEIENDPDYVWCTALEQCTSKAILEIETAGLVVGNWFTYANNEIYDDSVLLKCPMDIVIESSRVYHRLIVPHDTYSEDWDCSFTKGQTVDIIFTLFNGIDPHALVLEVAQERGMTVYMPQPCIPGVSDQLPAFYEFNSRVMQNYETRYGTNPSYAGVYQTNEAWLGDWYQYLVDVYSVLSVQIRAFGRQFVISPYVDVNRDQVGNASVAAQKEGFKAMARSGCDVIAVQEGRGCAKGAYFWNFQKNTPVEDVDPVLAEIVDYLARIERPHFTFDEGFSGSNQQLFKAFEDAVDELYQEEGVKTELWLNLEAFEYLRDAPCLPVDVGGNGMAELLDRTEKQRIDWGLTVAGARPTTIISFAWDADYLCTDGGFAMSLSDEMKQDWDRPIISLFDGSSNVLGFNIATAGVVFNITCSSGAQYSVSATKTNPTYGEQNNRSHLLQQATIPFSTCTSDSWVCISATNKAGKTSYHEWCYEH
ncbi:hypothetical protein Pelo_12249 [Pelomyxa schiedti]|nr:hypothetical protein Pelo_12249 [Pelomyxa schiedti]